MNLLKLLSIPEGRIFFAGLVSGILFLLWISLSYIWLPGQIHLLFAVITAHFMFGRAASLYLGLVSGLDLFIVIAVNLFVDTLWVLIMYPVTIFSIRKLLFINILKRNVERVQKVAQHYQGTIKRYGILGLFLFVVCPLPMTGPVVGGVIGDLMKLRPWHNITIILCATYVTVTIWAVVLIEIHQTARAYGSSAPLILFLVIILLGVVGHVVRKLFFDRHQQSDLQ